MPHFTGLFSKRNRTSLATQTARRPLRLESLEDRRLMAVLPPIGPPKPPINTQPLAYDDASILVQLNHTAVTPKGSDFLEGTTLGPKIDLVPGLRRVDLSADVTVDQALAAYKSSSLVAFAEPNYALYADLVPNDPGYAQQYALPLIDAEEAWDFTTGSAQTVVAVIDSGVDFMHPDLAANIWTNPGEIPLDGVDNDGNGFVDDVHGYDFANGDGDPLDTHGHGTHVAGTIGAVGNNAIGVAGVNWNVRIMAMQFMNPFVDPATGALRAQGWTSDAVKSLDYAVANGATISNNSWGGSPHSSALSLAISNARAADHIFVASAGNGGDDVIGDDNDDAARYPSSYTHQNIVAVASTDAADQLATSSNFGRYSVDLAAPGVSIRSTVLGNNYANWSGTSMAAPHVTGVMALVRSEHPDWSYQDVIDQVLANVDPVVDLQGVVKTGGRLNALKAIAPGAWIKSHSGGAMEPIDSVRVIFNQPIDPATFTPEDVADFHSVSFGGQRGVSDVTVVDPEDPREFVLHTGTLVLGEFQMTIGPDIRTVDGTPMNQDRDAATGETPDDAYTFTFRVIPLSDTLRDSLLNQRIRQQIFDDIRIEPWLDEVFTPRIDFDTLLAEILAQYDRALEQIVTGPDVADSLATEAILVQKLYQQVLRRDPETAGWQYWTKQVASGAASLGTIATGIFESDERIDPVIRNLYRDYLGRDAEKAGLDFWRGVWRADGGPDNVVAGIVGSPEFFRSVGGASRAWVAQLYRRMLSRDAEDAGLNYWSDQLDGGQLTRQQIVLGFVRSDENFRNLASHWYAQYLSRPAFDLEKEHVVTRLREGASQRDIQIELLDSLEYAEIALQNVIV